MTLFLKAIAWYTLLFITVSFNLSAQTKSLDYKPLIEKYRKIYQTEIKKNKVVGMSIALVFDDSIIWAESFGYRDKENKIKAVNSDQYLIGSVTKTFTGIGVMQLQQKEKLSIDDPLKKYLPEFNIKMLSGDINNIKIRYMMTHHSGIPGDEMVNLYSNDQDDFPKILKYINNDYTASQPNISLSYSNVAISLLGLMIEKVTGMKYADYIKCNIFDPLKMKSTGFYSANNIPDGVKSSYDFKGRPCKEQPESIIPAAAIYSNVTDMANYIKTIGHYGKFENKQIIDSVSLSEMFEVQNANIPLDLGKQIGLIWFLDHNDAGKFVWHNGATLHHRLYLAIAPESKFGVVLLTNSDNGENFQWRVAEMMGEAAKLKGFKATKIPNKDSISCHYYTHSNKSKFKKVKLSSKDVTKSTGLYNSPFVCTDITQKGNNLLCNLAGHKLYLTPITGNNFWLTLKVLGLPIYIKNQIFYIDTIDNRKLLIVHTLWGNKEIVGEKQELTSIDTAWRKRTGHYKIINVKEGNIPTISSMGVLKINYGILTFNTTIYQGAPQKVEMPLDIITDDLAQIHGLGRYGGSKLQIIKNEDGSENLLFMGLELKKQ